MTKCKLAMENPSSCGKDICCFECEFVKDCKECCTYVDVFEDSSECGDALPEENQMIAFEEKAITIMEAIANIATQKAALEEQDKNMRRQLEVAMEQHGVKSFENDIIKITYVEPTTRTSVDSAKLKKKYPSVFEECSKTSEVKGSVRISVKLCG